MKILYVEDNDDNVYMLRNRLTRAGFIVVVATDGVQGVAMAGSERPDLIIMDLTLPEMDGWETAREIRKHRPKLPVVLVTGYGATAQPPSGEVDLVAGIIGKPFDFDQVTGTIARVVAQ